MFYRIILNRTHIVLCTVLDLRVSCVRYGYNIIILITLRVLYARRTRFRSDPSWQFFLGKQTKKKKLKKKSNSYTHTHTHTHTQVAVPHSNRARARRGYSETRSSVGSLYAKSLQNRDRINNVCAYNMFKIHV
jgi:hypothetical protein